MLKFTPPREEQKKLPRYASYSVGVMKVHSRIVDAKNSLNNRMWVRESNPSGEVKYYKRNLVTTHSFILEMVNGEYFTLYEILPGLKKEQLPWMKEFAYLGWSWDELTPKLRASDYYGPKIANGEYRTEFRSVAMSKDEYADWRVRVELERRGLVTVALPE